MWCYRRNRVDLRVKALLVFISWALALPSSRAGLRVEEEGRRLTKRRPEGVTRVLLLSHQRSGSHFTANLISNALDTDHRVISGERVDKNHGGSSIDAAKNTWSHSVEMAFDSILKSYPNATVIGFIMQVNHIWCSHDNSRANKFPKCMKNFGNYMRNHDIKIIHLVRETSLLVISSSYFATLDAVSMTQNTSVAAAVYENVLDHPMPITKKRLHELYRLDDENKYISKEFSNYTDYFYLRYESLIDLALREKTLTSIITFLHPPDNAHLAQDDRIKRAFDSIKILELRPPSCKARVRDWRRSKFQFRKSVRDACLALERINRNNAKILATSNNDSSFRIQS